MSTTTTPAPLDDVCDRCDGPLEEDGRCNECDVCDRCGADATAYGACTRGCSRRSR